MPVLRRMMEDELHYSRMRAATVGLAIPNSTRYIVEEIAALIPQPEDAGFKRSSLRLTPNYLSHCGGVATRIISADALSTCVNTSGQRKQAALPSC